MPTYKQRGALGLPEGAPTQSPGAQGAESRLLPRQAQLACGTQPGGDGGVFPLLEGLCSEHFYGLLIVMLPFNSGCHSVSQARQAGIYASKLWGLGCSEVKQLPINQLPTGSCSGLADQLVGAGGHGPSRTPCGAGPSSRARAGGVAVPPHSAPPCVMAQLLGEAAPCRGGAQVLCLDCMGSSLGASAFHVYAVTLRG